MGGSPARIIRNVIRKPKPPPSSPIAERRAEVQKETEPGGKKLVRRKVGGRKRRNVSQLANYAPSTSLGETTVRNPRDTKTKLGA
ncbi:hypothetical protein [uncultured Mediterranean phage uvMED]|jgi:hypothetical protein|nr:hypothetical protein [uncultured Mediterranean phage uvMED]